MNGHRDEAIALARDFAAALEHLRDAWDLHYVGAGAVLDDPIAGAAPGVPSIEAAPSELATAAAPAEHRDQPIAAGTAVGTRSALRAQAASWSAATKLEYLQRRNVGDCRRCGLCKTRTNIVFGAGNPEADLMFVGEAPGADEDRQGEPFVGRAGQRLDAWIRDLGLQREDVYIANVLKCRPPGNRDPKPEEVDKCAPFLQAQIRAIRPKVLVALGRHAGMLLSRREDLSLRAMRGARLTYDATARGDAQKLHIPLVVTYHPAYVLRHEGESGAQPQAHSEAARVTQVVMQDLERALAIVHA
jgi:uracil-DNA glycosylase